MEFIFKWTIAISWQEGGVGSCFVFISVLALLQHPGTLTFMALLKQSPVAGTPQTRS